MGLWIGRWMQESERAPERKGRDRAQAIYSAGLPQPFQFSRNGFGPARERKENVQNLSTQDKTCQHSSKTPQVSPARPQKQSPDLVQYHLNGLNMSTGKPAATWPPLTTKTTTVFPVFFSLFLTKSSKKILLIVNMWEIYFGNDLFIHSYTSKGVPLSWTLRLLLVVPAQLWLPLFSDSPCTVSKVASGAVKLLIVKWVKTYWVPEKHLKYTAGCVFLSFIYLFLYIWTPQQTCLCVNFMYVSGGSCIVLLNPWSIWCLFVCLNQICFINVHIQILIMYCTYTDTHLSSPVHTSPTFCILSLFTPSGTGLTPYLSKTLHPSPHLLTSFTG